MTEVINLNKNENHRDLVHQLVYQLVEGKIIAFPTESVYSVCAYSMHLEAVGKLVSSLETESSDRCLLSVKGLSELLDFFPDLSRNEQKLLRQSWPGPLIAKIPVSLGVGLIHAFSPVLREFLSSEKEGETVRVRCPEHALIHEIMQLLPAPLVILDEMSQNGSEPVTTATDVLQRYSELLDVVIDDGPTRYLNFSSEIDLSHDQCELVHSDLFDEQVLSEMTNKFFLFVCTGNTCRSPLAEGLFRKILAEKVGCKEAELNEHGYIVASAGIAAMYGASASTESVQVATDNDVDITDHQSQPLSENLLDEADHIYTMTRQHRDFIISAKPDAADRIQLLSQDESDILDPIGGDYQVYQACKEEIENNLRQIIDQFDL